MSKKKSQVPRKKRVGQRSGQPPLDITPETRGKVSALAGFLTHRQIADQLGIGRTQLEKYCAKELAEGMPKKNAAVLVNLYRIATGNGPGSVAAAIFWVKTQCRWHEVQRVIHGFDPSAMMTIVNQIVAIIRGMPKICPNCKTHLEMPQQAATKLRELSEKMDQERAPSEIVQKEPEGGG